MPNTALKLVSGRQPSLFAEVTVDFSNVVDTAVSVPAIQLPHGAQVVGGAVIVDTALNGTTTSVLDVGDALSTNRYVNDVNLKATGRTALVPTGYVSDGAPIWITPVHSGGTAPTAGRFRVLVEYVIAGRATENQPN